MAETVTMPKLGFDMAEGTLVRWVVGEGQPVSKGAVLAEIETDKATVEVESGFDGVVRRHLVEKGAIVPVGTPIAIIGSADEPIDAQPSPQTPAPQGEKLPAAQTSLPKEDAAGTVSPPSIGDGPGMKVDDQLPGGVRATPLARKLAVERRVDLSKVEGHGPNGRIRREDVEAYVVALQSTPQRAPVAPAAPVPTTPAPSAAPKLAPASLPAYVAVGAPVADEIVPLNRLRGAIGRRMVEAKQQVPHFYITHEYDVAAMLELRKGVIAFLPDHEKPSVNDFVIKAVALGLRRFPNLNASLVGDKIVRHGPVNVGVAVAVEGGLLTVVCKDADRKPLRQIAVEVRGMAAKAREGKVRPDDIEGSTFSISNLGMFEVESFIAIINPPEAAILAVGAAKEVPVVKNGQVTAGMRMKATLSVDHRVSDGAEGARFLQALAEYLENPLSLLI
jgi:pyruvate dehydrogenase E2 component (dihydrolipoamide acetyltransferase)